MGSQYKKRNRHSKNRRTPEQIVRDLEAKVEELRLEVHKAKSFSHEQVRSEIGRLELTVAEYARLMEVTPAAVYRWMNRKTRPKGRNLDRWFALQGVTREEARSALGL